MYTGLQLSTYIFSEKQGSYTSKNVAPLIGGQMNIFNPRWSKSFSAQIDLSFSIFEKKTNEIYNQGGNDASWTYKVYDYKGYSFSGKLGIRYIYPKYKCRPVIEAGFSSLFFIDLSCEKYVTWVYTASKNTTSEAIDYKMKSNYYGYYAGLGMDYCIRNEQAVFFRVQFENYVKRDSTEENYNDNARVPQIKIGYTF